MTQKIGVYICHCGINIAGQVDIEEVVKFASTLKDVAVARDYKFMCSDPGQDLISRDISELGLDRVVVASCSPLMHELTFRRVCAKAGLNPYLFQMANIREHCSWVTADRLKATEKAKVIVSAAVTRVIYHTPLEPQKVAVNPDVLIVGAGIGGIQAALDIANAGKKVYLVEKEPSIGGQMAKLDKTFPTLDCAACILTPKMSQVGQHENITLLSYSEVTDVSGYVGNFKVKVKKKARFVDLAKCSGCGECTKVCPVERYNEFDEGLSSRKAIYIPFPQSVPNKFVIDKSGSSPCRVACPAGVNAQGYIALISQGKFREALEVVRRNIPFVGVCGRVCNHPCEIDCERAKVEESISIRALKAFIADYELKAGREKATPVERTKEDKVVIVGAGPAGLACAYDLVRKGYPVTVLEALPMAGGLLHYGIPEYRLPKEVLDNELNYIKELGVEIKTNTPVTDIARLFEQGYKSIFLSTGCQESMKINIPNEDARGVLYALDFLKQVNSGQKVSLGQRVIVIGGGSVAIDCARVATRLGAKEVHLVCLESRDLTCKDRMLAQDMEIEEAEEEGVLIHPCLGAKGILLKDGKVSGLETVICTSVRDESGRFAPKYGQGSAPTINADTIIIAIGQKAVAKDFAEVERLPYGTIKVDATTLQTNIDGVFAGGDVVAGPSDVIACIAAGKEAAISIDRYLSGLDLSEGRPRVIERVKEVPKERVSPQPRAMMPLLGLKERRDSFAEVALGFDEKTAMEEAKRCLNCAACSECLECVKVCEPKAINHEMQDEMVEIDVGSIIVTTGLVPFDPTPLVQYGYGRFDNVYTSLEFERLNHAAGPTGGKILLKDGKEPKSVAIIHCAGSRDENYHPYCSRVCCMYSLKFGHLLREKVPDAQIYEFYIDMRCFGKKYEEFYGRMLKEDIRFIRGRAAEVLDFTIYKSELGKLVIQCEDTLIGKIRRIPVDMVILSVALEARNDARQVAKLFSISQDADGFFIERHPKLDPVRTMTDGVFIAGCCQGPKDIPDTVAQAQAAAACALSMISKGVMEIEPITSRIDEKRCAGCRTCEAMCPYSAIEYKTEDKVCQINEAICKGCGSCAAVCPAGAITSHHFTREQIMAEVEGVVI